MFIVLDFGCLVSFCLSLCVSDYLDFQARVSLILLYLGCSLKLKYRGSDLGQYWTEKVLL